MELRTQKPYFFKGLEMGRGSANGSGLSAKQPLDKCLSTPSLLRSLVGGYRRQSSVGPIGDQEGIRKGRCFDQALTVGNLEKSLKNPLESSPL